MMKKKQAQLENLRMRMDIRADVLSDLVKIDPSLKQNAAVQGLYRSMKRWSIHMECVVCEKVPPADWLHLGSSSMFFGWHCAGHADYFHSV